jgi:hypothetical protein
MDTFLYSCGIRSPSVRKIFLLRLSSYEWGSIHVKSSKVVWNNISWPENCIMGCHEELLD